MNNLPIETYESVVQQRDELAAENANLKEVLSEIPKSLFKHVRNDTYEWQIRTQSPEKMIKEALSETPATDSFLAEVQAHGVDKLAIFAGKEYQRFVGDKPTQRKWKGIVMLCTDFAAQLRKGINDAQ